MGPPVNGTLHGRLAALRPDRAHPVSGGFACAKGLAGVAVHEDPDRLDHPQRRGAAGFEQASWDEAVSDVAARVRALVDRHGPASLALYAGNPTAFNTLARPALDAFFTQLDARRSFSSGTQDCAAACTRRGSPTPNSVACARARCATGELGHWLLPSADMFEREDVNLTGLGLQHQPFVQWTPRVVAPRGVVDLRAARPGARPALAARWRRDPRAVGTHRPHVALAGPLAGRGPRGADLPRPRRRAFWSPEARDATRSVDAQLVVPRVWNEHGAVEIDLRLDAGLRTGVVAMTHGRGHQTASGMRLAKRTPGVNANALLPIGADSFDPLSSQAFMTGIPVEVAAAAFRPEGRPAD